MNRLYPFFAAALLCTSLAWMMSAYAAQPTNINYSGKGSDYRLYTVRCSDGKQRMITSWRDKKDGKWCMGKGKKSKCSSSQLKAAKRACSNR